MMGGAKFSTWHEDQNDPIPGMRGNTYGACYA